uniref:Selectin P ligand n=1 Tax=Myripristis murdjan TaxID=586833 RepID=A0A668A1F1_9TELE
SYCCLTFPISCSSGSVITCHCSQCVPSESLKGAEFSFNPISPTSTPVSPSDLSNATTPGSPTGSPPTTYHTTISNISENVSTTATSNTSSGGGVIHRIPKRLPEMTTKSPSTTTTAPPKETGRDSVVSKCLIAIAALAGMATFFMVTTIILCTKLSSRKYHYSVRDSQQGTEMVCISALLSDRSCPHPSRYHPISNGVLLPSTEGDSDEDGGDNLTLSSFLPDSDRV